jgi:ubiquinone/menaquinone biosynthesis C-methylase UbiE
MRSHVLPPNHHADHPAFHGASGLFAAMSMVLRRGDVARLAADLTELRVGDQLVDVGCGPGAAAREAARRGAVVTGVDPATVMLDVARVLTCLTTRRTGSITWVEGAAEHLPLADGSATVAWSLAAVHHWADVDAGVAEIGRVLRPGGRLLAIERLVRPEAHGLASHGWSRDQAEGFATACRDAGCTEVVVDEHPTGRGPVVSVRALVP